MVMQQLGYNSTAKHSRAIAFSDGDMDVAEAG